MPLIAVVGATATGKTALAVALAQQLGTEIISADSRYVYRGLDIGTAKPTEVERQGIPHALIDVADPTEQFTVAQYQAQATQSIKAIRARGKSPIVVGGTGFYLRAVLQAPSQVPSVAPQPVIREALGRELEAQGLEALYQRLQQLDPLRASQLYPQDAFRIVRALEIIEATGQPVPQAVEEPPPYPVVWLGLRWRNRDRHRALLSQRIAQQVADGWIEEAEALMARYGADAHALQTTLGYPEWMDYRSSNATNPQPVMDAIALKTSQYAGRQRTWFNKNPAIHWLDIDDVSLADQCAWARQHLEGYVTK
ncbi:MAG: tRNA (adenosine(37)-N6)-dimethylallyltransferase MiaA [Vampirovibrionales bacterium]|nr:tRNA (adenosine(37)-N6)-dimethylallyltransferase MiaA [Vampirovibrionales bacterium]